MLELHVSPKGQTIHIRLSGRLDAAGSADFDAKVLGLAAGALSLVLDFAGVDYISSAGLRSLIKLEKALRPRGGGIVLCGLTPFVHKVLENAGLLPLFRLAKDYDSACTAAACAASALEGERTVEAGDKRFTIRPLSTGKSFLDLWGLCQGQASGMAGAVSPQDLTQATLSELGLALGLGGFGPDRGQALASLGPFFAGFNVAGVLPRGSPTAPDFFLTEDPREMTAYVAGAAGLTGEPQALVEIEAKTPFSLAGLLDELDRIEACRPEGPLPLRALLVAARSSNLQVAGSPAPALAPEALILCLDARADAQVPQGIPQGIPWSRHGDRLFFGQALWLDAPLASEPKDFRETLKLAGALEHLSGTAPILPGTQIARARAWVFLPTASRHADEVRIRVEVPPGLDFPDEWDLIVRRIYSEGAGEARVSRVVLTPLSGGFSSQNFYVDSFDAEGKRLIPTVLKIGGLDLTRREVEAYNAYVKKFILNNTTSILGSHAHGNWAGLRYNFVGVSGQGATLTWLTKHYQTRPAEELIPIFDRVYTDILKPWYGQPKWDLIHPYREHDPRRIFPSLLADAEKELGLSPGEPSMFCPELGRSLPNPYWFLKHVFPQREHVSKLWYTSVTHNDLNMQNILLDERENVYVIDFSETRPNNIVADFARLEPIFLLEMTRLDSEGDVQALARFLAGWYGAKSLKEVPPCEYDGDDPMVEKACAVMRRVRHYADVVTLFETDISPYLLCVLEWTLCVASYRGFPIVRKRMSAVMAGLVCEALG